MKSHAAQHDQAVRLPKVPDRPERRATQQAEPGQVTVRGHKKRNLQQQGQGSPQHVIRPVMILPVVGLQNHEALVAFESPLDFVNARLQPPRLLPFLLLNLVGPAVQRKQHQIDHQAQQHNGQPRAPRHPEAQGVYHIKQQFQRSENHPAQHVPNHPSPYPLPSDPGHSMPFPPRCQCRGGSETRRENRSIAQAAAFGAGGQYPSKPARRATGRSRRRPCTRRGCSLPAL